MKLRLHLFLMIAIGILTPSSGFSAPLFIDIDDLSEGVPTAVTSDPDNRPIENLKPGPGEQISFDVDLGANFLGSLVTVVLCEPPGGCVFDDENNVVNASDLLQSMGLGAVAPQFIHVIFQSDPDVDPFLTHNPDAAITEDGTFQEVVRYGPDVAIIRVRSDIPEPSTLLLLGMGFVTLFGLVEGFWDKMRLARRLMRRLP